MAASALSSSRDSNNATYFGRSRVVLIGVILALFFGGLALRLTNFFDPPIDVHGWRQLRSAAVARQIYMDSLPNVDPEVRANAHYLGVVFSVLEPPLFENLVALTDRVVGQEILWSARAYSILFWLIGGLALFGLAYRMTSVDGAIVALAYYLFLPFANTFSRTFLPEPMFIMWMLLAYYTIYRWMEAPGWKWAILTGLFAGIAILVKVFAVFGLIFGIGFFLASGVGIKKLVRQKQFWAALALSVVIPVVYYLVLIPQYSVNYLDTWSKPFLYMLKDPTFYLRWLHWLQPLFSPVFLLAAVVGVVLHRPRERWLALGMWAGYISLGLLLPSLITSHNYYSLQLVPVVALSLAPVGSTLLSKVARQGIFWQLLVAGVILVGLGDAAIMARKEINIPGLAKEPAFWEQLAKDLPKNGDVIGLLEDYNTRMNYYGHTFVAYYPYSYDMTMAIQGGKQFDLTAPNWDTFRAYTQEYRYFLVTEMTEFERQPYLKDILYGYYPVVINGDRYVLFDLSKPARPLPAP